MATTQYQPPTLLQTLHSRGSVSLADLRLEYQRVQQQRQAQGQRLVALTQPVRTPSPRLSMATHLLGNADKVIALVTGLTAGIKMIRRIKRLF